MKSRKQRHPTKSKDLPLRVFLKKVHKATKGLSAKDVHTIQWCLTPYPFGTRRASLHAVRKAVKIGLVHSHILYHRYVDRVMSEIRDEERREASKL